MLGLNVLLLKIGLKSLFRGVHLASFALAPWGKYIVNGPGRHLRGGNPGALHQWSQYAHESVERTFRLPYIHNAHPSLYHTYNMKKVALWAMPTKIELRYNLVVLFRRAAGKII